MQQIVQGVTTDDFDTDVGANATLHAATVGKLDLAVLIPFKAGTVLTRANTAADVIAGIADYDGYADEAIVWSAVSRLDNGKLGYEGVGAQMRPTGSAHPNSIGGFALLNAAKTKMYMLFNCPIPVPMRDALDAVSPQVNLCASQPPTLELTI